MGRKVDIVERMVAEYVSASAEQRRAFFLAIKAIDGAMGLGNFGQSLPKRRGRPVGSKNKAANTTSPELDRALGTLLKNTVEAQGVGQ